MKFYKLGISSQITHAEPLWPLGQDLTSAIGYSDEPSPGRPLMDLVQEPVPDEYELGRYLNILKETDEHLARLFDTVRQAGLADNTLIVITGDHGQAFGYPHNTYIQGRTIYEEDVNVPLMLWFPPRFRTAVRPGVIGSWCIRTPVAR